MWKIKTELLCRKPSVLAMNVATGLYGRSGKAAMHRQRTAHRTVATDEEPSGGANLSRWSFRIERDLSALASPFHFQRLTAFFH